MTTKANNVINDAQEMYQAVKANLPEHSRKLILTRIMQWQKQLQAVIRQAENAEPAPIFVMRPGLPPRPLDPFYFKLTDSYDD